MEIKITTKKGETIRINTESMPDMEMSAPTNDYFNKTSESKWVEHCRRHHFHPSKDAWGKIYEQYLKLCAEGLIK